MLKQAFRSYLTTLQIKDKKEETKKFLGSFLPAWIFLYLFSDRTIFEILSKVIPLLLIKWSNLGIGSYMGKIILLCPMNQECRKEYMNYMIGFKMGCPVVVGFIIEMMWTIFGSFNVARTLFMILLYVSYGIAENIHIDCIDKMDHRILPAQKDLAGNVKWAWMNASVSYVALIMVICYDFTNLEGMQGQFYSIMFLIASIYLIIMDIVILCTQYNDMLEEKTDYELAFHIPGRLHYIENV